MMAKATWSNEHATRLIHKTIVIPYHTCFGDEKYKGPNLVYKHSDWKQDDCKALI